MADRRVLSVRRPGVTECPALGRRKVSEHDDGASDILSFLAANTRPWPATMFPSVPTSTEFTKPNSAIEPVFCAIWCSQNASANCRREGLVGRASSVQSARSLAVEIFKVDEGSSGSDGSEGRAGTTRVLQTSRTDHAMSNFVDTLKSFHTALVDSCNGYEEALSDAEGKDLAPLFLKMIDLRNWHHAELDRYLRAEGEEPDEDGSFMSTVHRTVIKVRSLITGLDESLCRA